jgi:hypothetical protein
MKWVGAILATVLLGIAGIPAAAQPAGTAAAEPEPLIRHAPRHRRPRIEVRPRVYPYRHFNTVYPPPYDIEYPGPNAKRQCVDRYVVEHRPSGVVVTPRMRCWWVRG